MVSQTMPPNGPTFRKLAIVGKTLIINAYKHFKNHMMQDDAIYLVSKNLASFRNFISHQVTEEPSPEQ